MRRRLLIILPIAVALVVAVVLSGPGRSRAVGAARAFADGGESIRSLRVLWVERDEATERPRQGQLQLYADGESTPRWTGSSSVEGVAEISLDEPLSRAASIKLISGNEVLASGPISPVAVAKQETREREDARGEVRVERRAAMVREGPNGVTLSVGPCRGVLVPPFQENIDLSLQGSEGPIAARMEISALSADLAQTSLSTGSTGEAKLKITPLAQPVILSFEVGLPSGKWATDVPLAAAMSGMFVEPDLDNGRVVVVSPGPRTRAFLSFHDQSGRIGGAFVELTLDDRGFMRGTTSESIPAGTLVVIASGEPNEKGPTTTVWPTPGTQGLARAPTVTLALDGMPNRVASEQKRVRWVHILTVLGLSFAAALELALILWTGRSERNKLAEFNATLDEESIATGGGEHVEPRRKRSLRDGVLIGTVCALVALSFAMIAILILR